MRSIAVIPARYGSTRLSGKPLSDICGKPMVWWVYQQVSKVKRFAEVVVATDDERIMSVCKQYRLNAVMTSTQHTTAIHRLHEVAQSIDADFYVQVNGDEPLIDESIISKVFCRDVLYSEACGVNLVTKMESAVEVNDLANIKVVFNENKECVYMSRVAIPCPFKSLQYTYYKHIGVIGYSKAMLDFYVASTPGRLEKIEGIDLLRFVDYSKKLYIVEVNTEGMLSVDTEKDLEEVRKRFEKRYGRKLDIYG